MAHRDLLLCLPQTTTARLEEFYETQINLAGRWNLSASRALNIPAQILTGN
jgi:hypothetical protein